MAKCVALIGAFNTKRKELEYIRQSLLKNKLETILIDLSCLEYEDSESKTDYSQEIVANKAGVNIEDVFGKPLFKVAPHMSLGASRILSELIEENKIHGCIGIGGANGTLLAASVMENLPFGFPKAIISVMAAVDSRRLISHTDIVLFNTIGDAVLNPVLEVMIKTATAALKGMVDAAVKPDLPQMVGLTVLGVTDQCVHQCMELLSEKDYPYLLLHSNGPGGATLEKMTSRDAFWGILDITTNELLNNLLGGVFDAGSNRLEAAVKKGLPLVVSTGAVDFVNFWGLQIPEKYHGRLFIRHNIVNTLMRTDPDENALLGRVMAERLNRAVAPVKVLIPEKGFSKYDRQGGIKGTDLDGNVRGDWYWPEANRAFVNSLQENLSNELVRVEVKNMHVNDPDFSRELVDALLAIKIANEF
ncbi:MAG: Tm-1-like ATP-binding domain-containing protein [Bacillota bacterium]|nr:Tm-1-like ATP-binding domain-containing protein [Bacillota bacterium]